MRLTDLNLDEACKNPDGATYNGLTVMRWLYEALTKKPLSEEEARLLEAEARARIEARKTPT